MVVKVILTLGVMLTLALSMYVEHNENVSINCQFGRPLHKQVDIEPLNGKCLRDIVIQLSKTFYSLANKELGIATFQGIMDKQEFINIPRNLPTRLNKLVDQLNTKLESYAEVLKQSSTIVQQILLNEQAYSAYHDQMTNIDALKNLILNICPQILTAFSDHFRSQEWKNLHILLLNQPGVLCGSPTMAHNIGSLLLSQCSQPKNVILLIEHSTFMSDSDLALAQITAKTIIEMLSENDYVTVVGLADNGSVYCKNNLMHATDINKYQLACYIDNMTRIDSNRSLNVDFKKLMQGIQGEVVIIHLTNTLKCTTNLETAMKTITTNNIITYYRTILILSEEEPHENIRNILQNDTIIILPTQDILASEIIKLFSGLKCFKEGSKNYYLSDPYFDLYSKTMTFSIGKITNVAFLSLDVRMQDFLDEVTYFNAGSETYTILFDSREIVWMHKTFPRMEMMTEQPLKVYLRNIENISKETVMTMINQSSGILNLKTRLGEMKQYRWKHLDYTNLIVCLVSSGNNSILRIPKITPSLPADILHHRLDLILQTAVNKNTLCTYQNKITTVSTGVVYLSPWCFQSPMEQLKLLETGSSVTVQSYMAYIKDLTGLLANPGLHQTVRPDVATLAQIVEYFKKRYMASSLSKFIIRRYAVSTTSGVLEMFPGLVLDPGLDPKRRAWYQTALDHPGKVTFTTPYLDAAGSGYVVTLSHTIYEGRSTTLHFNNDPVAVVISMDVPMGYISRLLMESFPFCNDSTVNCFLMDNKGYLVSHPALLEPTSKVELQHLTHKELLVANDILNHAYFLKKKLCASHLDGTIQRYYQFNTSLEEVLTNIVHGEHCVKYQVTVVPGTNVFLGIVNVTCSSIRAFCPCSTKDRLCLNCKRMEQTECECPCECSLYTSDCVQSDINLLEPCPAPYEQGISPQTPWIQATNLKPCPFFSCKEYHTEQECLGVVGCQWCHIDSDGETLLKTPFCSDLSLCFKGIFGSAVPHSDRSYNSQSADEITIREWPSVGPVAGGVLAFVLILGVTLFCYRLRSVHSGLEHECLHLRAAPDTLRMTHAEGDPEPLEPNQTKNNLNYNVRDNVAPISPYRVSTNYRRPPRGDSDHGYSTMTPHDDSEQQTFVEPLILTDNADTDPVVQLACSAPVTTQLGSPHHVLAPVTVHRNMETNCC